MHPRGRLRLEPCQEIEGSADTDHDWGFDASDMISHPILLFWGAQTNPDDIRPRLIDEADDVVVLVRVNFLKGGV